MLQAIFKDKSDIDRNDDQLGQAQMSTMTLVRMMIRDYLWPNKGLVAVSMLSMLVVAATTGALPILMKISADEIIVHRDKSMLTLVPIAIVVIMVSKAVAEYVSTVTEAYIGIKITADLRKRVIDRLMHADIAWLSQSHSGRYVTSFMNDVQSVTSAATLSIVSFAKNLLRSAFLIGAMFVLDWKLALLAVGAIPFAIKILGRHRNKTFRSSKKAMAETGDMGALITQALSGIRVVKAYDREDEETGRISRIIDRANEFAMRTIRIQTASGPMTEALTGLGLAAAILYGGWRGQQGNMTLGEFMGFITAAMLIYQPLRQMATLQTYLQTGVAAASRIFAIIDHRHKVVDRPGAQALPTPRGDVAFDNVSFDYDGATAVLDKIAFTIPAGQKFALVGASGSGKSTIMNLLLRFYDPVAGQVRIDGHDIADHTISSVRQAIALVTQDPFLFDDTIRANIAYGSEHADEAAIERAARAAVAHDFIMALPKGYDTEVGEAGSRLSGGQKQRIAIARAMLRDAPVLLLDEPTSALDSESEAKIQLALDELIKGKTVLMIAHRLSTVRNADTILVLDRGKIVETGTHQALLRRNGAYARLHEAQIADTKAGEYIPETSSGAPDAMAAKPVKS